MSTAAQPRNVDVTPEQLEQIRKEIEAEPNVCTRFFGWYLYWNAYLQMKGLGR